MIIADTNIVSELMRPAPAKAVLQWATSIESGQLALTVITITEIEYGLARLPEGRRQRGLVAKWRQVMNAYSDEVFVYGAESASAAASILDERDQMGRPISLADAQIAGICRVHSACLATRNTKDFTGLGLDLVNPFPA